MNPIKLTSKNFDKEIDALSLNEDIKRILKTTVMGHVYNVITSGSKRA